MNQLTNIVSVPAEQQNSGAAQASQAQLDDVALWVFNASPFPIESITLDGIPLMGTPLAGVVAAGTASAATGQLTAGGINKIVVTFDGGHWSAVLDIPTGPPRPLTLFCYWNGCVLSDYNGNITLMQWQ